MIFAYIYSLPKVLIDNVHISNGSGLLALYHKKCNDGGCVVQSGVRPGDHPSFHHAEDTICLHYCTRDQQTISVQAEECTDTKITDRGGIS